LLVTHDYGFRNGTKLEKELEKLFCKKAKEERILDLTSGRWKRKGKNKP
jgi:hypothetical protein